MIREKGFVLSRGQFAILPASLVIVPSEHGPAASCLVRAVWYRRKAGVLRACTGYVREWVDPGPRDVDDFLRRANDGRYGGHCEGRWDGERYWGAQEPEVMEGHLALLRPMIEHFPLIPEGYQGWWRFPTTAELRRIRGLPG